MSERDRVVLVLDIGGTNYRLALVNEHGQMLEVHKDSTFADRGPDQAIKRITDVALEMLSGASQYSVEGMGIAVAGLIEPSTGTILTSPNMLSWYGTSLKAAFEKELQLSVCIGNDANMAALGEYRFGAGSETNDLIYLTVSTGIGGGVITGGKLLAGSSGFGGELGHMTIDINGPRCNCGNVGCLEMMASGTAIARLALEAIARGEARSISEYIAGDLSMVSAKVVENVARMGDEVALEIMNKAAVNLGCGIVSLVHIFNPDVVIIGGGVSNAGELLFGPVRQIIEERVMQDINVRVMPAALGDECGLLGAAALVLEQSSG